MLNPYWKKSYDPKDLDTWRRMEATTPPFFDNSFITIEKLLFKYFRTSKGYSLGPGRSWYQKKEILARTMQELERAIAQDESSQAKAWEETQRAEESLETRLQREEDLYEKASARISRREINTISWRQS